MLSALIKAPDCFASVMTLLDPIELQDMRSVSKEIYKGITKKLMFQSIKSAIARYTGPHAMPDGAVRLYSPLGYSTYDICKVEGVYQLKMKGFHVQNYEMMETQGDNPEIKLDTLLSHSSLRLRNIITYVIKGHETTKLEFMVNIKVTETYFPIACFFFELPDGSSSEKDDEIKNIHFRDFDFHEYRLFPQKPTLLQQLFEAKDKISALESAQRALQTRLADAERRAARVGN